MTTRSVRNESSFGRRSSSAHARDEVDARVVAQVVSESGGHIDSQDEVGGWPDPPPPSPPPEDRDRDGMADDWERKKGLDPTDPEDRHWQPKSSPYPALEFYLHGLTGTPFYP